MDSRFSTKIRTTVRSSLVVLAAVTIAASAAGCAPAAPEPGTSAPAVDAPDTLRFAAYGPPIRSWDPARDGRVASNLTLFAVYDRLIGQAPDGSLIPQLATKWEFTNDTTFTMELRKGVKFQDGTKFDADAVKANIERTKTIDNGAGPWAGLLGVIDTINVKDATHITFNLKSPAASLPAILSDQPGAMISPAAFDTDLNQTPVGAGMYTVESWTKDGSATLKAFDGYWDKAAIGPKTIYMPFQLDQLRRLDMFKADEVDATFGHTTFVAGAKDAGIKVKEQPGINYWFMDLNRSKAPFDNVLVRQAINHALDQKSLVKGLLFGEADVNEQPFNENSLGFSKKLGKDVYTYDLAMSKDLLKQAGFGSGLTFDCAIVAGSGGAYSQYAEVVKAQLAKVGITMNVQIVQSQSTALLIDHSVNCAILPYGVVSPILNAKQLFSPSGYYNAGKVADDETVKLLAALDMPQSDKQLKANFATLADHIKDEALFTSLFFEKWAVVSNEHVEGLQFYLGGYYTEFRNIKMK